MKIEEAIVYVLARRNGGLKTDQIAEIINRERLFVCKDGRPVSSAFVYRTPRVGYSLPDSRGERGMLVFPDYTQDNDLWIRLQDYQHEDWPTLVQLWQCANRHSLTRKIGELGINKVPWGPCLAWKRSLTRQNSELGITNQIYNAGLGA